MNPTMTQAIEMVRSRIGETTPAFWQDTPTELVQWINEGVAEQHRVVLQKAQGSPAPPSGNRFLSYYIGTAGSVTSTGVADYPLPTDFTKMILVEVNGVKALPVNIVQDTAIKTYPQYAPTPEEPKYAFSRYKQIRFYMAPGSLTVPMSTVVYRFLYYREPVAAGTAGTVDCPSEYMAGPVDYAAAKCLTKGSFDPAPLWAEFKQEVDAIAP